AAVYNSNDKRDLKRQIENLEKGPARPGRADDLKDLEEDLKAVQNQQATLDNQQAAAEKAYQESTKPLVDRIRAASEKLEKYIRIREESLGIDEMSRRKSDDIHVDHLVS